MSQLVGPAAGVESAPNIFICITQSVCTDFHVAALVTGTLCPRIGWHLGNLYWYLTEPSEMARTFPGVDLREFSEPNIVADTQSNFAVR